MLAFDRGRVRCLVNLSPAPVPLAGEGRLLLASQPGTSGVLETDTAAWLQLDD